MVKELSPYPHRPEGGRVDPWHLEENEMTMNIMSRHLFNLATFASASYFDLSWMLKNKEAIERKYVGLLR
jgi:hypothetical protein